MDPELKAYLDDYHARTMARYDASDRLFAQYDALLSRLITGASIPQPARSTVVASDGGLTVDATVVPVVPDTSSCTTKAQETLELIPGASPASIEMVPVTCSTECSTQVVAVTHVDEVHDVNTTVRPEPDADINDKEVDQLTPAWAPPTISTGTSSLNKEVVPSVATTIDIDPKAGVQESDTSILPSVNTSTPVISDGEHGVLLVVSSNLAAPAPTMRWADCPVPAGDWVKPLTATIDSADETHDTAIAERLHPPSFEHQPWPLPVQVQFNHMRHLFRPSPWPSFRPLSVTSYPEEPCSSIHSQSLGGSCFSPWLVRLMFRDVHREGPGNGTDSVRPCTNGIQHKVLESFTEIGPLAVAHPTEQEDCLEEYRDASSFLHHSHPGDGAAIARESDVPMEITKLDKGSSLQKCLLLLSDPEYQSACSRKVDSFFKNVMEVLDSMSEVSPREEIVESYPIGSETISNSGDELKLIHNENTPPDCSTVCSSQNWSAQDTSGVQLPVDNSCLVNSVCSVPGYQDDLAVTNVDDMLKPMINGAVPGLVFHYAPYKVILLLPWCAKFLSIKPCQLLLDKGYLKCHITLGEINSKMLQSSVVQYVQPANLVPGYLNSCAVSAASYCGHWHSFTQFKRLWAPRTTEEVFGQMWSEPLFHAFCRPWDASDKQWNSEGHHKQYANLLVLLVYSTVKHIDSLQFRCNAKSCPPIAQILNEPQVLECACPVASDFIQRDSSCCCFFLATCAPCVRDQPKVNSSTSTSALTSPLAQQLDHNFSVESIFELLLHILQQTSCSKFTPADHNLDKHNSETANRRTSASVVHNSNKFTSTCYMCLGIPLVDSRTPLMELELLITQPGEHFPLLQPKPPWSPLFPLKIPTEFRSYMRTNSEFLRLAGVLWELTQSWTFTDHVSTLSSYWWCFSWGPDADLITALFWLAHIIAEKLQEGMPCISESSTACGGLHAMRSITEDYPTAFILTWQFIQSIQPAASSCVQWDPGGFDFAELAENRHRLGGKPVVKEEGMSATQYCHGRIDQTDANTTAAMAAKGASPPNNQRMGRALLGAAPRRRQTTNIQGRRSGRISGLGSRHWRLTWHPLPFFLLSPSSLFPEPQAIPPVSSCILNS